MQDVEPAVKGRRRSIRRGGRAGETDGGRGGRRSGGVAQEQKNIPDPELGGEGDRVVEDGEVPARPVRGRGYAEVVL